MADKFTKIIYKRIDEILKEQGSIPGIGPDQSALPGIPPGQGGAMPPPPPAPEAAAEMPPVEPPKEGTDENKDADKVLTNVSLVAPNDFNEWLDSHGSSLTEGEEQRAKYLYNKFHNFVSLLKKVQRTFDELGVEGEGAEQMPEQPAPPVMPPVAPPPAVPPAPAAAPGPTPPIPGM